jgi:succinyl-diaminopimelate desuccinylase
MSEVIAVDPVALTRDLIRCRSITPQDDGALAVMESALSRLGFTCHRLPFSEPGAAEVHNLLAVIGEAGPHFCFAGHSDVVPPGNLEGWTVDPFGGMIIDGAIYGRGANDMKGALAAMVAAVARHLQGRGGKPLGRISLLITGDEEGPAINGTRKVLEWMAARDLVPDACVVGEPTNPKRMGEMVKIGRRGSLSGRLTVHGIQGHVAYPQFADNPLHSLVRLLADLVAERLDDGTPHFQPSNLQITSIDTDNEAPNVIPAQASAAFNIRFNDLHTAASLEARLRDRLERAGMRYELQISVSGEAFVTAPGAFTDLVSNAVRSVTGITPELSTSGGTSDARFIKDFCKVAEFGLVGETMHKVDERASAADIERLTETYRRILDAWFEAPC